MLKPKNGGGQREFKTDSIDMINSCKEDDKFVLLKLDKSGQLDIITSKMSTGFLFDYLTAVIDRLGKQMIQDQVERDHVQN